MSKTETNTQENKKKDSDKKLKKSPKKSVKELENQLLELTEELATLKQQQSQYEIEAKESKEDALKYMAELENFKRRKQQEVDTFKKYAAESVIVEFLPILDNFLIACEHAKQDGQDQAEIIKGFVMIQQLLTSTLDKLNVTAIDALDQPFDPNIHQAISQDKKDGVKPDTVIKEMQKGYKLHDRVIRPSMVVVSQ